MRTYGSIEYKVGEPRGAWVIDCEPQVRTRVKRVFANSVQHGSKVRVSDTIDNCRDLTWFLERYPMEVSDLDRLHGRSEAHQKKLATAFSMFAGDYVPREFKLAVEPRVYQRVGAEAILEMGGILIADDPGLGKTMQAICAMTDPRTRPALVVTLTHLPQQWKDEIERFAPGMRVHILKKAQPYDVATAMRTGKIVHAAVPDESQASLPGIPAVELPDVLICNPHKLHGWVDHLEGKVKSAIFDEVQEFRHVGTNKYEAARRIAHAAEFRVGLSATPIHNFGGEFWSVIDLLCPDALGDQPEFAREWCVGEDRKLKIVDPKAFGAYVRENGIMLRRTRSDVSRELPKLTKVVHTIEADVEALEKLTKSAGELAKIILAQGEAKRGDKMQAAEEFSNLMRQATGIAKAVYVADFVRMLVESGEKVVLYGWHRAVYEIWLDRLSDMKPAMFTGSESPTQKAESKRRFMAGETPVLIISLRAGAGMDGLQYACRTVVYGELDWAPAVHIQSTDRVYRDGQPDPVMAYYLVSDHGADPIISDVLGLKRAQSTGVLDPTASLVEKLDPDGPNIRRLAEAYLARKSAA